MHILRLVLVHWSAGPSTGEGTGSAERPSDHVQECGSEEEIHNQATGEAEQNEVEESKKRTEDDNTGAAVEIKKSGDKSTDYEDEDTSEEEDDISEDEKHRRRMTTMMARNQVG
jgi:hypothetical protein